MFVRIFFGSRERRTTVAMERNQKCVLKHRNWIKCHNKSHVSRPLLSSSLSIKLNFRAISQWEWIFSSFSKLIRWSSEMCLSRNFLTICLIAFAIFQFYQVISSFYAVFVEYDYHYERDIKIKVLTAFNIAGMMTSSVMLIIGSVRAKPILLIAALTYLLFKIGFIVWHFKAVIDITFNCGSRVDCDPKRLFKFYLHILITSELNF